MDIHRSTDLENVIGYSLFISQYKNHSYAEGYNDCQYNSPTPTDS